MNTINNILNTLYQRDMLGVMAIQDVQTAIAKTGREVRQTVIDTEPDALRVDSQRVDAALAEVDEALGRAEKTFLTDEGRAALAKVKPAVAEYRAIAKEVAQYGLANQNQPAAQALVRARAIADKVAEAVAEAVALKKNFGKKAYDESDVIYARQRTGLLAIMFGSLVLAVGSGYFLANLISKPLQQTVDVLQGVAAGDLTRSLEVTTKEEVGQMAAALNSAVGGIRDALSEVRSAADNLATASQQLASGSEELSSGAQEQASSLEETSASLEEITGSVKQNADSARQANQLAAAARDTAEKGGQVVSSAVAAMGEINTASKKIADIITAIDEIAFQTNLLALNAAVEAARAGEQGRGFAVVAAEVRTLAQRSATAAKEIKALIQDSVRKVEAGSQMVNESGDVLLEIVSSVKRVTDIVGEIAAASREQASGVDQVGKAMAQVDTVTQQTAGQTEELSSTAQNLSASAEQLQGLVARFRLENERSGRHISAPPANAKTFTHNVRTLSKRVSAHHISEAHPPNRPASNATTVPVSQIEADGGFVKF
jgi:methyl-accepting chemotaxis protein